MARNFKIVGGGGSAEHVDVDSGLGRVGGYIILD